MITDPFYSALIGTTQAIDLMQGGVKANAATRCPKKLGLSSITELLHKGQSVSHILLTGSVFIPRITSNSVAAVQQHDIDVLKRLARDFNLTYTAFGSEISTEDGPTAGTLTLTEAWGTQRPPLVPAPLTPFGEDSAPWLLLSGTIKATFNAHRGLDGADNIFVSPGITTGNTGGYTSPVCLSSEQRLTI